MELAAKQPGRKAATNCAIRRRSLVEWAICASILLVGPSAAEAASSQTELRTKVSSISETRSAQGWCSIGLEITGDALTSKVAISSVRAIRAVDDTGANLVLPANENHAGWVSSSDLSLSPVRGSWEPRPARTRFANLQLTASARSAKQIVELEGELELLAPTFENGGVVFIENFMLQPGRRLQETHLKKHGVTLTCLTKESYETRTAASGLGTNATRQRPPGLNDAYDRLFPGILGDPNGLARNYVVLKLDDPQQRVAGFAFRDPDGRLLSVRNRISVDDMLGFYFDTVLSEKLSLLVYLAVPEATERVPFSIRNIPLP